MAGQLLWQFVGSEIRAALTPDWGLLQTNQQQKQNRKNATNQPWQCKARKQVMKTRNPEEQQ